jgi:hypothetical protein
VGWGGGLGKENQNFVPEKGKNWFDARRAGRIGLEKRIVSGMNQEMLLIFADWKMYYYARHEENAGNECFAHIAGRFKR